MSWAVSRKVEPEAEEWEVVSAVAVRLEPRGRIVSTWSSGTLFWGEVCGEIVEACGFLGGCVAADSVRRTGRSAPWREVASPVATCADDARHLVAPSWQVIYRKPVAIREQPHRASRTLGVVRYGERVRGVCEGGWVATHGGFVATRTPEHGQLLDRDVPPDYAIELDGGDFQVSARTVSTTTQLLELLQATVPAVNATILAVGGVDAPKDSTAFDLGYRTDRQQLSWRYDAIAWDQKITLKPAHLEPFTVRAGDTVAAVIAALCDANPNLEPDLVVLGKPGVGDKDEVLRREQVVEDDVTAWAAGMRDGGVFAVAYLGRELLQFDDDDDDDVKREDVETVELPDRGKQLPDKRVGDEAYRNGKFEAAVEHYSRCLAAGDESLAVRGNRAAAYKQLGNNDGVVGDCDVVLAARPDDVKALLRRAEALEALEDYKGALVDVEAVLALRRQNRRIGDKTAALCQQMRHRLCRAVKDIDGTRRRKTAQRATRRLEKRASLNVAARKVSAARRVAATRCVARDPSQPHKASLVWLVGPDDALSLDEVADLLQTEVRRDFPSLRILVARPPRCRLSPDGQWFDLDQDDWREMLQGKDTGSRKRRLLTAQIDESVNWVKSAIVNHEMSLVEPSHLAIGGFDQGAVVATHVACRCPVGALVALNGPTPLLPELLKNLDETAARDLRVWAINGSHHKTFPADLCDRHNTKLRPHFKTFATTIVPYGDAHVSRPDASYVAIVLSLTIGPYRHGDIGHPDLDNNNRVLRSSSSVSPQSRRRQQS
ncbi:hypothetical protein CTAYLR_002642 [Chrysophaeum taylorii]|uniref:Phospholipase/carboxylesterase/thioesterase domain-containing protein n=1 Tax=Chrysophaeum taylorii TaxID=2483200 RepID=A0AAD7UBS8_9STRA|nr:hypothetical protein CTAYLR_002642 [Chrysophaeum taylorii]